jgi:hypothetical protein
MSDTVRVYVKGDEYRDHEADDFSLSPDGLTVSRYRRDGGMGQEAVAVYAPGQFLFAERRAEEVPPP